MSMYIYTHALHLIQITFFIAYVLSTDIKAIHYYYYKNVHVKIESTIKSPFLPDEKILP